MSTNSHAELPQSTDLPVRTDANQAESAVSSPDASDAASQQPALPKRILNKLLGRQPNGRPKAKQDPNIYPLF